jgi:hypothetical protein
LAALLPPWVLGGTIAAIAFPLSPCSCSSALQCCFCSRSFPAYSPSAPWERSIMPAAQGRVIGSMLIVLVADLFFACLAAP